MTDTTTEHSGPMPAVGAPVERPVRPLVERLRDCAQGVDLGAEGMGWSPDPALLREAAAEIERLRAALEKIADWDSNWGPFPENNEAWRAMVVVTAREAVPRAA